MVLNTKSWSLFTVTRRSSPNDAILAEREADIHEGQGVAAHEEGEDIGRIRLPSELQTKITHRSRALNRPRTSTCLWALCMARDFPLKGGRRLM
jgi:hypothetical protein